MEILRFITDIYIVYIYICRAANSNYYVTLNKSLTSSEPQLFILKMSVLFRSHVVARDEKVISMGVEYYISPINKLNKSCK